MDLMRTPPKKKAKELAKYLRAERPDYLYLKSLFQNLRTELEIEMPKQPKRLPYVPNEDELKRFYNEVWESKVFQDMIIIKTFVYTGVRVSELVNIKITEVDLQHCQIRINLGKGSKDRIVPFPEHFKELLAMHISIMIQKHAVYLFESKRNKKYTDRGIRALFTRYSERAGMQQNLSPHKLRHFILTYLKRQGIDDALIQPYSGHSSRKSLEIYSRLAITDAQDAYNQAMKDFPI